MRAKNKVALAVELSICSEKKGADQLRGYHKADLRLCFRICKLLVFSCRSSNSVFRASNVHQASPSLKIPNILSVYPIFA